MSLEAASPVSESDPLFQSARVLAMMLKDGVPAEQAIYAALSTARETGRAEAASAGEAGWRTVPVEPTEEMLEASLVHSTVQTKYTAMVEAAPVPPTGPKP